MVRSTICRTRRQSIALVATLLLVQAGCASRQTTSSPDPAGATMVADRLFLGRQVPGGGAVSDAEWTAFLAEVVTPRFPEGLTVWRAEGQWQDERGVTVREPVMVLEVLHPSSAGADAAIVQIAEEYRRRFRQEAVLRVTEEARVRVFE
jgi:hypothetical protein